MITIHNLLILDESGSMHSIYDQALTGANETIQSIRAAQEGCAEQDQRFTFVTFNTAAPNIKTVIDDAPIGEVKDLTEKDYRPNACTPLYDAMGVSITALESKVKEDHPSLFPPGNFEDEILLRRVELYWVPQRRTHVCPNRHPPKTCIHPNLLRSCGNSTKKTNVFRF